MCLLPASAGVWRRERVPVAAVERRASSDAGGLSRRIAPSGRTPERATGLINGTTLTPNCLCANSITLIRSAPKLRHRHRRQSKEHVHAAGVLILLER